MTIFLNNDIVEASTFWSAQRKEWKEMDILQAIRQRHSVRAYTGQRIEEEKRRELDRLVSECNEESGLHIQICYDDPDGFDSTLAHYGKFRNVNNYIILAGKPSDTLEEKCGYYGEKIVLEAQAMGLNTCWVALTFNKSKVKKRISEGEKMALVIAIGYGETQGVPHKSRELESIVVTKGEMPDWFRKGAEAALLAPTAINQQKFKIGMKDGKPVIRIAGRGPYLKIDLGIVKYHFEAASGHKV